MTSRGCARNGLLLVSLVVGCALLPDAPIPVDGEPRTAYRPDRRDYMAFREAYPDVILEPNYLPFMVHRKPGDPATGDLLLFCRWPASSMPIRVYVEEAIVPEEMQNEFNRIDPARYTEAIVRALETWEAELEGLVTFQRVESPRDARLRLRVLAEEAPSPEPDVRVLGSTQALVRACETHGWDPDSERLEVSFTVSEALVYAADEFGLLTPAQIEAIALHELGHALGMLGHSPVPTDLMYRVLGEQRTLGLSTADVNSFVSLYRLPNGTHYGHVQPGSPTPRPDPVPPSGGPQLAMAPHVDSRLGFEVRMPTGWLRVSEPHGLFAANGPIWDHEVSMEIFVWPYPTIEAYLERFAQSLFANTWRRYTGPAVIAGRRALEVAVEDASGKIELDFFFVELGDGRVMVILTACPVEVAEPWRPWFQAALGSLEIWSQPADVSAKPELRRQTSGGRVR